MRRDQAQESTRSVSTEISNTRLFPKARTFRRTWKTVQLSWIQYYLVTSVSKVRQETIDTNLVCSHHLHRCQPVVHFYAIPPGPTVLSTQSTEVVLKQKESSANQQCTHTTAHIMDEANKIQIMSGNRWREQLGPKETVKDRKGDNSNRTHRPRQQNKATYQTCTSTKCESKTVLRASITQSSSTCLPKQQQLPTWSACCRDRAC